MPLKSASAIAIQRGRFSVSYGRDLQASTAIGHKPGESGVTVDEFITMWENCSARALQLCRIPNEFALALGVETPGHSDEYRVDAPVPGGAEGGGTGFIDLYKRGPLHPGSEA
jgi:hypothetical protein